MSKLSVLDKFRRFNTIIKQNGGVWGSLKQLYRVDEIKDGELVGTDSNGNKYFQNPRYFYGRNRWVIYANKYGLDYDGSQVDPQWHPWLHYMCDVPPTVSPPKINKFVIAPKENQTGTSNQYVPYSTVKPKIQSWVPPSSPQQKQNETQK